MWRARGGSVAAASAAVARGRAAAAARGRQNIPASSGASGGLLLAGCPGCRAVHHSAPLCGSRNLLQKFLNKKKKKFWYDSPSLGSYLVHKPSNLNSIVKLAPPKVRKEDSIRKRTLDVLFFKAVRGILSSCEAGEEVYRLNVELTKGSLAPDFSACRIYWKTTGKTEQDDYIDKVLQQIAPRVRHLLISNQVKGIVPPIVFVKDKADAAIQEIERLLAIADFGPEEEENKLDQNDFSKQGSNKAVGSLDAADLPNLSNLFGINHEELNKKIIEYKKMRKDEAIEGVGLSEQQKEQLAEIQKQKKLKRKKTRKASDITPEKYFLERYSDDYWDSEGESLQDEELEDDWQEIEKETEVHNRNPKVK